MLGRKGQSILTKLSSQSEQQQNDNETSEKDHVSENGTVHMRERSSSLDMNANCDATDKENANYRLSNDVFDSTMKDQRQSMNDLNSQGGITNQLQHKPKSAGSRNTLYLRDRKAEPVDNEVSITMFDQDKYKIKHGTPSESGRTSQMSGQSDNDSHRNKSLDLGIDFNFAEFNFADSDDTDNVETSRDYFENPGPLTTSSRNETPNHTKPTKTPRKTKESISNTTKQSPTKPITPINALDALQRGEENSITNHSNINNQSLEETNPFSTDDNNPFSLEETNPFIGETGECNSTDGKNPFSAEETEPFIDEADNSFDADQHPEQKPTLKLNINLRPDEQVNGIQKSENVSSYEMDGNANVVDNDSNQGQLFQGVEKMPQRPNFVPISPDTTTRSAFIRHERATVHPTPRETKSMDIGSQTRTDAINDQPSRKSTGQDLTRYQNEFNHPFSPTKRNIKKWNANLKRNSKRVIEDKERQGSSTIDGTNEEVENSFIRNQINSEINNNGNVVPSMHQYSRSSLKRESNIRTVPGSPGRMNSVGDTSPPKSPDNKQRNIDQYINRYSVPRLGTFESFNGPHLSGAASLERHINLRSGFDPDVARSAKNISGWCTLGRSSSMDHAGSISTGKRRSVLGTHKEVSRKREKSLGSAYSYSSESFADDKQEEKNEYKESNRLLAVPNIVESEYDFNWQS